MAIFDTTSITAIGLGIGSAAALFALHRLRVQPTTKTIATLLFWRQAVQQQKTRVLPGKFSHPLTYLLLVAIALLLAMSLIGDQWQTTTTAGPTAIVIDAGYTMAAATPGGQSRLAEAQRRAADEVRRSGDVSLIAAGARARLLSAFSDPRAQFDDQLNRIQLHNTSPDSASALQLAFSLLPQDHGRVIWYTDQPAVPEWLPTTIASRIRVEHLDAAVTDAAIIGVIYESSATDAATGRLRVRVGATPDIKHPLSLKASPAAGAVQTFTVPSGSESEVTIEGVIADGATWTLQLIDAPGLPGNDTVTVRLPKHSAVTFRFHGNVPEPVRAALLAIGTQAQDDAPAAIDVMLDDAAAPKNVHSVLRLITVGSTQTPSGAKLRFAADTDEGLTLDDIVLAAGPALSENASPVLRAGDVVVAAMNKSLDSRRELRLSSALWDTGSNLPKKAAFPVLMQRFSRQLAGWSEARSLPGDRILADPLWADDERQFQTLVYSRPPEAAARSAVPVVEETTAETAKGSWPVLELLLAAALTLLTAEGLLLATRKIV